MTKKKIILDIISEFNFAGMTSGEIKKDIRMLSSKIIKDHTINLAYRVIEICIAIVDDESIRKLNYEFRNIDKATNVLSFPCEEVTLAQSSLDKLTDEHIMLGDVIISYETVEREALDQGKKVIDHLRHMVVHGILHLLGYDHEQDDEAHQMELLETSILASFSTPPPYDYIN